MAYPSITYDFVGSTTISSGKMNTNFSDLVAALSDGSKNLYMNDAIFDGDLAVNGDVALGNTSADTVTINGKLVTTHLDAYVGTNPEVGGASPFQLTISHNRKQLINPAGDVTVKLPTTGVLAGEIWTIDNRSTNVVSVQSSGANAIAKLNDCTGSFIALQATPTTAAHWEIHEIKYRKCEWENNAANWAFSAGFGAVVTKEIWEKRIGDTLYVRGYFKTEGSAATDAYFTLPTGYVIDSTKFGSTCRDSIGYYIVMTNTSSVTRYTLFYNGSTTNKVYFADEINAWIFDSEAPISLGFGNNDTDRCSFEFSVPLVKWALT